MKFLLYVPSFQCEGANVDNVAQIRIGGLTIFERACRSAERAGFSEIIVASPKSLNLKADTYVKLPIKLLTYEKRVGELSEEILKEVGGVRSCVCRLDGLLSPECMSMRPVGANVRIYVDDVHTGVYFLDASSLESLIQSRDSLDEIAGAAQNRFQADDKALYHRIITRRDIAIATEMLMRSLRKPLGRDADGLVAYFINRPMSLQISRRIANTPITPNMITVLGLLMGIAAAILVGTGQALWMTIGVISFQFSSMIDGVDGELARLRMTSSHSGEWFDTVADDIVNIGFMLGLGFGLQTITGNPIYLYIAIGVCSFMCVSVGWFYIEFVRMGIASHNHFEWGFESKNKAVDSDKKPSGIGRMVNLVAEGFAWIAKRDFYTFLIMCLILLSLYKTAYFIMLVGAAFVGIGGFFALSIRAVRRALR